MKRTREEKIQIIEDCEKRINDIDAKIEHRRKWRKRLKKVTLFGLVLLGVSALIALGAILIFTDWIV